MSKKNMNINKLNQKLLSTLGLSCAVFLIMGIIINVLFPIPSIAILIERSYCSPEQWIQITKTYEELYQKHQQKNLNIKEVVLFNSLGKEVLSSPPLPDNVRTLNTYGSPNLQLRQELQNSYPQAKLLQCQ